MQSRLIYTSKALAPIKIDTAADIVRTAARVNSSLGITGILVIRGREFLQVLEGERRAVSHLALRISRDVRHEQFSIASVCDTDKRAFIDWWMGYAGVVPGGPTEEVFNRFLNRDESLESLSADALLEISLAIAPLMATQTQHLLERDPNWHVLARATLSNVA